MLDVEDFIPEAYFLEVSSPGLGRQLKKEKDFAKADAIREELLSKGVAIKDTREGVVWELV